MPSALMTSTMNSEPGRSMVFAPCGGSLPLGFSVVCACAVTVPAAASVVAAPLRKVLRSLIASPASDGLSNGRGRHRRDGRALQLERRHGEGELVHLLRRQLVELQVLQDVNAVHHQEHL